MKKYLLAAGIGAISLAVQNIAGMYFLAIKGSLKKLKSPQFTIFSIETAC